jgi:hypothetical protein
MILFPVGQREKKSCQTESASRLRFRLVIRKKTRDAIARLFPVDQPGKYEREPISSSLIVEYPIFLIILLCRQTTISKNGQFANVYEKRSMVGYAS